MVRGRPRGERCALSGGPIRVSSPWRLRMALGHSSRVEGTVKKPGLFNDSEPCRLSRKTGVGESDGNLSLTLRHTVRRGFVKQKKTAVTIHLRAAGDRRTRALYPEGPRGW